MRAGCSGLSPCVGLLRPLFGGQVVRADWTCHRTGRLALRVRVVTETRDKLHLHEPQPVEHVKKFRQSPQKELRRLGEILYHVQLVTT